MRESQDFVCKLRAEMNFRVHYTIQQSKLDQTMQSNLNNSTISQDKCLENDVPEQFRQYYDMLKIKKQGRFKQ